MSEILSGGLPWPTLALLLVSTFCAWRLSARHGPKRWDLPRLLGIVCLLVGIFAVAYHWPVTWVVLLCVPPAVLVVDLVAARRRRRRPGSGPVMAPDPRRP